MNERLKILRKEELKLTLEEFGKRLGVGQSAISMLENGSRNLTDQMILSICREFNVREKWLREGSGPMFVEKTKDEEIASFIGGIQMAGGDNFKHSLILALSRLDDKQWDLLEGIIDRIAAERHKKEKPDI